MSAALLRHTWRVQRAKLAAVFEDIEANKATA